RLGRTQDHMMSPCLTTRRARLGAASKSYEVVRLIDPGVTEEMSTYSISPSKEPGSVSLLISATSESRIFRHAFGLPPAIGVCSQPGKLRRMNHSRYNSRDARSNNPMRLRLLSMRLSYAESISATRC